MTYADPLSSAPGSDAIGAAVDWIQAALLGTVAATIAVIAIAATGFGMLWGRIDLRRGAVVVIGCFVIFGASMIASGILASAFLSQESAAGESRYPTAPELTPPVIAAPPDYDPYAGAAVPSN